MRKFWKFIAKQAYLRKQEKSQINNLTFYLREPEREEQTKPKVSQRKMVKIRVETDGTDMETTREIFSETKSWFSEKVSKMDKLFS